MPSSAWRSTLFPYTTLFRSDRKSTRLNSSHDQISYAVFCLKKKNLNDDDTNDTQIVDLLDATVNLIVATYHDSLDRTLTVMPSVHLRGDLRHIHQPGAMPHT